MSAVDRQPVREPRGPLMAAAMVARDGRFSVRVVLPHAPRRVRDAEVAADQAGVDIAVERTAACATVHFIARHQDRRLELSTLRPEVLRPMLVRSSPLVGRPRAGARSGPPTPRAVDLVAFECASDALALGQVEDAEAELIWGRLLHARARAHLCGGIPTLIVNDVGGLVGLLRQRARRRGAAVRVNPDACACR